MPSIEVVELRRVTSGGRSRTRRNAPAGQRNNNPSVHGKVGELTTVRLHNVSTEGAITVTFRPVELTPGVAAPSPFGVVPPPKTLQPGEKLDLTVTRGGHLNFITDPANAAGASDSDIHIDC